MENRIPTIGQYLLENSNYAENGIVATLMKQYCEMVIDQCWESADQLDEPGYPIDQKSIMKVKEML